MAEAAIMDRLVLVDRAIYSMLDGNDSATVMGHTYTPLGLPVLRRFQAYLERRLERMPEGSLLERMREGSLPNSWYFESK